MEDIVITKEIIVKTFMNELDSVELVPVSDEFKKSISNYVSQHAEHLTKKPVSEMQKVWLEKDQLSFDKTINLLNLWGKLRRLKEIDESIL